MMKLLKTLNKTTTPMFTTSKWKIRILILLVRPVFGCITAAARQGIAMISEQRRLELEKLAAAVNAAHDRYYCEMDEADFADEFAEFADDDGEDEVYTAWYRAILRQREIGFDAFAPRSDRHSTTPRPRAKSCTS